MRIGVTGATGFVGRHLVPALRQAGHHVVRIGRGRDADVRWDPASAMIDVGACAGIDAFVNLAGENIGGRWTSAHRRAILESRVQGTSLLARTAAALTPRPRVLVCASAIGIYGEKGDAPCNESAAPGTDYLSEVGLAWERAADASRQAGIRTVHARFGVLLGRGGGALSAMLPVFRRGLGARLSHGRQWMSWLAVADAVAIVQRALDDEALAGPVNAVSPSPVTNAEFTRTLARVVGRPALFAVPAVALRLLYGELADATLLISQRVVPAKLQALGFAFQYPTLDASLRAAVEP